MQSILDRILKHDIHRQAAKKTAPKTGANVLDFLGHFQKWLTHFIFVVKSKFIFSLNRKISLKSLCLDKIKIFVHKCYSVKGI